MELTMNNEMMEIDGGGWKQAFQVFFGTVLVAVSPVIGIAGGMTTTPVGGAVAGAGAFGLGLNLIGAGTHK